jgi:GDPmannose 4,6-dehydratase
MEKRALITGIGGQDGSLLAELLLEKGYEVFGVVRRDPSGYPNLADIRGRITMLSADLLDQNSLERALQQCEAREVYNLASVSFVPSSWDEPVRTAEFAAVGVTTMLEAIRAVNSGIRFYQASSSEIFGEPLETPQNELTPLAPLTPYGVAKAYGHFITRSYRTRYGLHASSGILYNHESPRRPVEFLPRKVSLAVARIKHERQKRLRLGSLDAQRDWGYAGDAVRAMWLMLQQQDPGDYVIATGRAHSVRDLVQCAFEHVELDYTKYVDFDPELVRGKAELHHLVGDATHAREQLGWQPTVSFRHLVGALVDADLAALQADTLRLSADVGPAIPSAEIG